MTEVRGDQLAHMPTLDDLIAEVHGDFHQGSLAPVLDDCPIHSREDIEPIARAIKNREPLPERPVKIPERLEAIAAPVRVPKPTPDVLAEGWTAQQHRSRNIG